MENKNSNNITMKKERKTPLIRKILLSSKGMKPKPSNDKRSK